MGVPQPLHKEPEPKKKSDSLSVGEIVEAVYIKGDLKDLTPVERAGYLRRLCESLGLNPLTKPFEYITLQGKLTLYATKACSEQLRKLYHVSVISTEEMSLEDVYIVKTKVKLPDGRTDEARGAVKIGGLKGDHLANAIMKAETKSKRRATLSICGLAWMDETELETVEATKRKSSYSAKKDPENIKTFNECTADIEAATDSEELQVALDKHAQFMADAPVGWAKMIENSKVAKIKDLGGEANWIED